MPVTPRPIALAAVLAGAALAAGSVLTAAPSFASSPTVGVTCASHAIDVTPGVASTYAVECQSADDSPIDSFAVVGQPTHAAAFSLDTGTGELSYTAVHGFSGADTVRFTATAGDATSDPTTITFNSANTAPTCLALPTQTVIHDHALPAAPTCTDVNGDPLTLVAGDVAPSHGVLTSANGMSYTPSAHYVGPDSFTVRAFDGAAYSSAVIVPVQVTDAAPACAAVPTMSVVHDTAKLLSVVCSDADGDAVTTAVGARAQHGTVVPGTRSGEFVYTAARHYLGADVFTLVPRDGVLNGAALRVPVMVTDWAPALSAPDALHTSDSASFTARMSDTDRADRDNLSLLLAKAPTHGRVVIDGTRVTYQADRGFAGTDRFSVRGTDGVATTPAHPVVVTVVPSRPEVRSASVRPRHVAVTIGCERFRRLCSGSATMSIDLGRAGKPKLVSATNSFSIPSGGTETVNGWFDEQEQVLLAASKQRSFEVVVKLTTHDSSGQAVVVRKTLTVDNPNR